MRSLDKSLHIKGGVRETLAIALPMVVSQACDTIMIFTDRLFLAKLGPEFMSAAMGGGLTVFMLAAFFVGLTSYTTALVAQYLGARLKKHCALVVSQAAIISFAAYIPILALKPLAHRFFEIMHVPASQLVQQNLYFDVLLYGVIFTLLRNTLSAFFSGIGRTRIVMTASCTAMIVNVIFNYIFVFGKFGCPAFGIRGSACGTIIGGLSGFLVLLFAYLKDDMRREFGLAKSFRFDKPAMKKLIHFGSPQGFELFLNILAFDGIVLMFHSLGPATAAAATIVFNWDLVSFVPLIGIEIGVTSLVGRSMGSKDPETAEKSVNSALKIGLVYSAVIFILFVGFPKYLVDIFSPDGDTAVFVKAMPMAVEMVRLAAIYVLVEAMFITYIGALRGAGDTLWAMAVSVSLHWILVPILFILLRVMHMPATAGWATLVFTFFFFSFLVYIRFKSGHWKKIKVIQHEEMPVVTDGFHETSEL